MFGQFSTSKSDKYGDIFSQFVHLAEYSQMSYQCTSCTLMHQENCIGTQNVPIWMNKMSLDAAGFLGCQLMHKLCHDAPRELCK